MDNPIVIAVLVVAVIGLLCAVMLTVASKFMAVEVDERIPMVRECLPGANCGACGFAGGGGVAVAPGEAACAAVGAGQALTDHGDALVHLHSHKFGGYGQHHGAQQADDAHDHYSDYNSHRIHITLPLLKRPAGFPRYRRSP